MNQQLYATLKPMTEPERKDFLVSNGMSEADATDFLASAFMAHSAGLVKKREEVPFTQSAEYMKIGESVEKLMETIRVTGESKPEPIDYFQRDILLNQFLMNGTTIYDEASLYNPKLIQTEVIKWYQNTFRNTYKKSALVIGGPESGKTWGTLAYMNSLTTAKGSGKVEYADSMFITAFKLSEMFHDQKKHRDSLDAVLTRKHLLIDDLGAEPSGFRGNDFIAYFDYLFSERHKFRRYTFLTSNATTEQIKTLYGMRFISRFNEVGSFLETTETGLRGSK